VQYLFPKNTHLKQRKNPLERLQRFVPSPVNLDSFMYSEVSYVEKYLTHTLKWTTV